jgi:type VI secretion system protein ImpE
LADTEPNASDLFRAGKLNPAIEAANATLRRTPADLNARVLLAELLVFAGNFERADNILDAAAQIDPAAMIGIAEFRRLLRAATARRQHSREGRVPEFLDGPTPSLRSSLAALVAFRAGDMAAAARHAADAEAQRPRVSGNSGDRQFDDFRDADDLHAGFFEVLTTTGKYFWIPTERVGHVEFHPPRRPRDLAWRRASVSVINGPDGEVYLPAIYEPPPSPPPLAGEGRVGVVADDLGLGRATDWIGPEDGPVRGVGQRVYVVGDDAVSIMELTTLSFDR